MSEARYFPAGTVLVDDAALRRTHNNGLCRLERRESCFLVAALDCFLDLADRTSQHRTARFIHFGPARDHAGGFAGGLGIGHRLSRVQLAPSTVFAKATRFYNKLRRRGFLAARVRLIVTLQAGVNVCNSFHATRLDLTASWPALTDA